MAEELGRSLETLHWNWLQEQSSRARRLPDFIIIGAQRGGTSSLYDYLAQHPYVARALKKEIHFFDNHFSQGTNWYRAHFPPVWSRYDLRRRRAVLTGEASPYYLFHPHVPARLARLVPHVKLIALLRHPVDRAYSHYHLEVRLGMETLSFEQAITCEPARIEGEIEKMARDEHYQSLEHQSFSYLTRGIYVNQLRHWFRSFPREQMLILRSEDLYSNPAAVLKQTCEFLNLPPWAPQSFEKLNEGHYPPLDSVTRERLCKYFSPYNQALYEYLGVNWHWEE
jgi:hypothetical protein